MGTIGLANQTQIKLVWHFPNANVELSLKLVDKDGRLGEIG